MLGYLAAGIVIGPSVLGLTGEATDVMSFAEFGITVMLFLVGLELQPDKLGICANRSSASRCSEAIRPHHSCTCRPGLTREYGLDYRYFGKYRNNRKCT